MKFQEIHMFFVEHTRVKIPLYIDDIDLDSTSVGSSHLSF
jgi:hypothetical protein